MGKKREEEWASEIPEFLESHFLPLRQSWEGCWTSPLISREDCGTLVAPSLHTHWIEAGAAGNLVKAGASLDNLGYADCWGCSERLAATQACPVFALCLLSVLFFTATQWDRYHYYSNCPEERLLVNQERSNEVLNTSISRSDGGRGELQIWKTVSRGSWRPWLHGVTGREVSIMTPRFLSWVTGWIILPCADMRAYTDFRFGTVWSEVSEQHPTGKSHERLDILVWAWARCQVENSESSSHRSACLHTHTQARKLL